MTHAERNVQREYRIMWGITVDAYDEAECAMGWYYYLDSKLHVPFHARCVTEKKYSPLAFGEIVRVIGLAKERDCLQEICVEVQSTFRKIKAPLSQLRAIDADDVTNEAIEDWHYWVNRGYQFSMVHAAQ
ncbi:MAG: calcium-binding protein [Candidatus Zhuqueibacterota bacterium]